MQSLKRSRTHKAHDLTHSFHIEIPFQRYIVAVAINVYLFGVFERTGVYAILHIFHFDK